MSESTGGTLISSLIKDIIKPAIYSVILSTIVVIIAIYPAKEVIIVGSPAISFFLSYMLPVLIYLIFILIAFRANQKLEEGVKSEDEITRIIDKYEGIVDGIGTAFPLIGAALILYMIGQIDPNFDRSKGMDPFKLKFIQIAIPFEIKSILILAAAKLFEPVFDTLALTHNEKLRIRNLGKSESVSEIVTDFNNLKTPDEKVLKEIQKTSESLKETIMSMKDEKVVESIDKLIALSNKLK